MRIDPIWRAIGPERATAFPAFHAFTGADNTGRFSRIGKATWLQVYIKADRDVISSLQMLSTEAEVTQTMLANLARFVCAVKRHQHQYHLRTAMVSLLQTYALPAPKAIIEMVSCHCKTDCSSARCSCRTNNVSCTDLCRCGSECQNDDDS